MCKTKLFVVIAALTMGCSDDTFIATNEVEQDSGVDASSGGSGGGGGAAGMAGAGGEAGLAGEAGMAGAAGSGGAASCSPGETQNVGTCAKCGTKQQTCDANGQWGPDECVGQGACEPGATTGGCSDPCQEKTCQNDCTWGGCKLKSGAKCLYESGTNFQCCGSGKWQFCSSTSCDWYPCAACSGCGC